MAWKNTRYARCAVLGLCAGAGMAAPAFAQDEDTQLWV